jgi:formate hydrogenlyase subunit 3/multisubunit Na+/H+ antiporter MnhD subunit
MDPVAIAMLACYAIFIPLSIWGMSVTFYDDTNYGYRTETSPARLISEPGVVVPAVIAIIIPFTAAALAAGILIYRFINRDYQNALRRLYNLKSSNKIDGINDDIERIRRQRIEELEYQTGVGPRPHRGGIAKKVW